jgi:hypothetical protein
LRASLAPDTTNGRVSRGRICYISNRNAGGPETSDAGRSGVVSPDRRQHRGAHPEDARLFDENTLAPLRVAVSEMSWLLGRGYQPKSALKLVGDRHGLRERQRLAVGRAACSDEKRESRRARCLTTNDLRDASLIIDGFNLVITLEAALGGGLLVLCRDAALRDLSSVHGSYRAVEETERAILLAGEVLESLRPAYVLWLLDRPVSNSGRLAARIRHLAVARGWPWKVETEFNPDRSIINSEHIAVTSDSNVLDGVKHWFNFTRLIVEKHIQTSWLIDLSDA